MMRDAAAAAAAADAGITVFSMPPISSCCAWHRLEIVLLPASSRLSRMGRYVTPYSMLRLLEFQLLFLLAALQSRSSIFYPSATRNIFPHVTVSYNAADARHVNFFDNIEYRLHLSLQESDCYHTFPYGICPYVGRRWWSQTGRELLQAVYTKP